MSQFILKCPFSDTYPIEVSDGPRVHYDPKYKKQGYCSVQVGHTKSAVQVHGERSWCYTVDSADRAKKVIRRIRPQESTALAKADADVAAARQLLREATRSRDALLKECFAKGHVVTFAELKDMAAARQATYDAQKVESE